MSGLDHGQCPVGVLDFLVFLEFLESLAVPDGLLEHRVLSTSHRLTQLLQRHLLRQFCTHTHTAHHIYNNN